jgi:hypothetical protein
MYMINQFYTILFHQFKLLPIYGLCFSLVACQYIQRLHPFKPIGSTSVILKDNKPSNPQVKISSASYTLKINPEEIETNSDVKLEKNHQDLTIEAKFILEPKGKTDHQVYELSLDHPSYKIRLVEGSSACTIGSDQKYANKIRSKVTFKCLRTPQKDIQLKVSYSIPINELTGHSHVTEGERKYHLVYLPPSQGGDVFLGFNEQYDFPRIVTVQGHKRFKLFGHPLLKETEFSSSYPKNKHKEDQKDVDKEEDHSEIVISWSNTETDTAYPIFFGFGSWETPSHFDFQFKVNRPGGSIETLKQSSLMISPLGSQHHRVGKKSLKRLQIKTIQDHTHTLEPLWVDDKITDDRIEQRLARDVPLLWIILPDHPEYTPPDLREYGLIFLDESWFYRFERFGYAMPKWEHLLVFKHLYVSLQARLLAEIDHTFLKTISWWRALSHLGKHGATHEQSDQYSVYQTRELENHAATYRGLSTKSIDSYELIFGGTMRMIISWLEHKKSYKNKSNLIAHKIDQAIGQSLKSTSKIAQKLPGRLTTFGRYLNHLDSHLKQILESYMSNTGLPLVYVKWSQQKRGDFYDVRFTLSQRPFAPGEEASQLNPAMWIVPICLKLGIKDNPARAHCILLDQPEASHYELTLEAPLEWVHPNVDQSGLYLWSIDQKAFHALLKAKALNLAEFLALSEMSEALLETPQGSPITYLKSVKELAGAQGHPLSLDLLFTHLNKVVQFFGSHSQKTGCTEQWASTILDAVMISKPHFDQAPLKHLTQLQLAQWDQSTLRLSGTKKSMPRKEREMIKKFLRPTSNQEAIEDDVEKVELDVIQYPLLLQALSGDQKLWDKLYQKLAESEDQPLSRLLIIQALVQFLEPDLFKQTLDLLALSDQLEGRLSTGDSNIEENDMVETEDTKADGTHSDKTNDDVIAHEEIDQVDVTEDEGSDIKFGLRAEDALELIRGVRSLRAKRLAWAWLMEKGKSVEQAIYFGGRSDIQLALLEWSDVICDATGLKQLEETFKGRFGFKQTTLEQSKQHLRTVRKCVRVNILKASVETWIKSSLGTCK